jgi:serine/threonine protein kinase
MALNEDLNLFTFQISSSGICKLADFGCSKDLYKMETEQLTSAARTRKRSIPVGTPGFMAPELLLSVEPSVKSDVFSFGIFMWQLLAKERMPFPGLHMHTIMFKVSYRDGDATS